MSNKSMFVQRGSKAILAAGKPSEQPYVYVADDLQHYLLKEEVDALINDADYRSYWKKPLGTTSDLTLLPAGFDNSNSTFGRQHTVHEYGIDTAYDLICPKDTPIPKTSPLLDPGYQTDRHYCRPPYDPNESFGVTCRPDKRGTYEKCFVTNDGIVLGGTGFSPRAAMEADIKITGNFINSLTTFPISSGREFFLQCLGHLNTLRVCLSKVCDDQFFKKFYMHLKYLDKTNTGWLPKEVVYDFCTANNLRVNPNFIEPLLEMWKGFDGSQIQYRIFVDSINFTKPSADIPKIPDLGVECYSTTYNDMVRPRQHVDRKPMAGYPSVRIDKDKVSAPAGICKADCNRLPKESDVRSCISPSNFTHFGIAHRDLYAKRSPKEVRELFEAAGEHFTDKQFTELWDEAEKYHSLGWVCYATFRNALDNKPIT